MQDIGVKLSKDGKTKARLRGQVLTKMLQKIVKDTVSTGSTAYTRQQGEKGIGARFQVVSSQPFNQRIHLGPAAQR